jgi:hypothetical protein
VCVCVCVCGGLGGVRNGLIFVKARKWFGILNGREREKKHVCVCVCVCVYVCMCVSVHAREPAAGAHSHLCELRLELHVAKRSPDLIVSIIRERINIEPDCAREEETT